MLCRFATCSLSAFGRLLSYTRTSLAKATYNIARDASSAMSKQFPGNEKGVTVCTEVSTMYNVAVSAQTYTRSKSRRHCVATFVLTLGLPGIIYKSPVYDGAAGSMSSTM